VFPGPTIRTYSDRPKAQSVVRSYEPGTTVQAYVQPSAPSNAFLIRERTPWPTRALAVGSGLLGLVVLAGLGEKRPGQHELRPEHEVRSPPSRTWVERNDERLRRLSKWALLVCFVAFWLSMVGLAFGILSLSEGSTRTVEADLLGRFVIVDQRRLPLVLAAVSEQRRVFLRRLGFELLVEPLELTV